MKELNGYEIDAGELNGYQKAICFGIWYLGQYWSEVMIGHCSDIEFRSENSIRSERSMVLLCNAQH